MKQNRYGLRTINQMACSPSSSHNPHPHPGSAAEEVTEALAKT